MIYFIQDSAGHIKIGHAHNLRSRMRTLQTSHALPLRLLATMEGDYQVEYALHQRFVAHRIPGGEWFRPAPELLAFIGVAPERPAPVQPLQRQQRQQRRPLFQLPEDNQIPAMVLTLEPPSPVEVLAALYLPLIYAAALTMVALAAFVF